MPPKKKPVDDSAEDGDKSLLSVEDFNLPRSMILRLAKGVLPPNTSVQKDAATAILKSTTLFINYLASNADDRAQLANKKTIRPEDVLGALEEIEFGHFKARVEQELAKYQEVQNNKRNDYRRRMKEDPKSSSGGIDDDDDDETAATNVYRDKSTTPLVVTLGNGDREQEREKSSLRFGEISRPDGSELEADDEPPAAKKARTSLEPGIVNGKLGIGDEDDTLSDVDGDGVDNEEEDDEDDDDEAQEEDDQEALGNEDPDELAGLTDVDSDNAGDQRRTSRGLNPDPDDTDEADEDGKD